VRREAVGLLNRLGEPAACEWLVGAMNDDSADIRERAARGAYQVCDESLLPPSLADALTEGLGRSNRAAAAILLAGRFSGDRILDALLARADDDPAVKLHNWSAPVPASLPAAVALLRLGHEPAEQRLLDTVSNGELGQQVFLLQVLDEIQDADLLRALAGLLSDRREIDGGVPSGATPRRRLCDLAVDAFAARFDLDLPFALAPSGRYSDGQIEEARQRIESRLGSR